MNCIRVGSDHVFSRQDFPLAVRDTYQSAFFGKHFHDGFLEIVLVIGGKGTHSMKGCPDRPITIGDLLVIPEHIWHCYRDLVDLRYYNILLEPTRLGLPMNEFMEVPGARDFLSSDPGEFKGYAHLDASRFQRALFMIRELRDTLVLDNSGMRFTARTQLMALLGVLAGGFVDPEMPIVVEEHRLCGLVAEMEEKLKYAWTVDEMCRITHLSRPVLFRDFQRFYEATPMDYLLSIRIRHACNLLAKTSQSIAEIAYECGFCDTSYFIYRFRRRMGMTPREFRKKP